MPVGEYTKLCEYSEALEENWGKPPGQLNSAGNDLLIYGKQYGNVFIGVQPTFGYEGDPMRLLFSRSASPHHGFAAYYTYLEKVFKADAVLHFGTHGSLEFMPGKQVRPGQLRGRGVEGWSKGARGCMPAAGGLRAWARQLATQRSPTPDPTFLAVPGRRLPPLQVGMSGVCYPDSLIGTIPNLYYYAANNPRRALGDAGQRGAQAFAPGPRAACFGAWCLAMLSASAANHLPCTLPKGPSADASPFPCPSTPAARRPSPSAAPTPTPSAT